jgi:predicted YcjX-like family ATPase
MLQKTGAVLRITDQIGSVVDDMTRRVESAGAVVSGALFEPVVRLGVTGLARSGKTVFITALVANLLNRGRMPGLIAAREGAIRAVWLQPQPDMTVPRFDYEAHLAALTGDAPRWPASTRAISELRLSFRVQPRGMIGALSGPRTLHLDIVDYPGEWLLDLALMDRDYATWSVEALGRAQARAGAMPAAAEYLRLAAGTDGAAGLEEPVAQTLARAWCAWLEAARDAGLADCTPGRFLQPGDMAGSPVLTFAPLAKPDKSQRSSLWRAMERRYDAYRREVVRPFFRDHFARIDRQVVLADVLGAVHAGPAAVEDLRRALAGVMAAFRPGRLPWLARFLGGRRVERILFAATKADHLHHSQHARLAALLDALLSEARGRADFAGARTEAMAIAAFRATVEETRKHDGAMIDLVRGTLADGRQAAFHAGELPEDPARILSPAREGAALWLAGDYAAMAFAPARMTLKPGEGPPHIRLDLAAEFLIGDRLR